MEGQILLLIKDLRAGTDPSIVLRTAADKLPITADMVIDLLLNIKPVANKPLAIVRKEVPKVVEPTKKKEVAPRKKKEVVTKKKKKEDVFSESSLEEESDEEYDDSYPKNWTPEDIKAWEADTRKHTTPANPTRRPKRVVRYTDGPEDKSGSIDLEKEPLCMTKADIADAQRFLRDLAQSDNILDVTENDPWFRRKFGVPLEFVKNGMGGIAGNPHAKAVYDNIVKAISIGGNVTTTGKRIKNSCSDNGLCGFCYTSDKCNARLHVNDESWPIGSKCIHLVETTIDFYSELKRLSNGCADPERAYATLQKNLTAITEASAKKVNNK